MKRTESYRAQEAGQGSKEVVSKQMADVGKRAVTMSNTYTEKHKCKMTIFLMLG
jgi:hypothetical protein